MFRVLFPALALISAPAAAQDWTVDMTKSRVGFETEAFGGMVEGIFETWAAQITLDPADLSTASIEAEVTTGSGATGNSQLDSSMLSEEGLDPEGQPTAYFVSRDIRATDTGYEAHGILTIRGTDQPLILPFTLTIQDGRAVADAHFEILRADYGVGGPSWGETAATVAMTLHIEADAAD